MRVLRVLAAPVTVALGVAAAEAAPAPPRVSVADVRIAEGDFGTTRASFAVTRTGSLRRASSVRYAVTGGTAGPADFGAVSGRLVFRPRQRVKRIAVAVRGDELQEPNETFFVRLSRPSNARLGRARARATIVDDDHSAPPPPSPPAPPGPTPPPAPPANQPPIANAGPDQFRNVVDSITLDGRGSTDPEGAPLTYSWSIQSRPAGSTSGLTGPTTAQPSFSPDMPGAYSFQLTVSDGALSASDTVSVTASSQVVRFAVLGSMGESNVGQTRVAAAMKAKCDADGCDYVLGLGDNIYPNGASSVNDAQFNQKFEEPYKDFSIPFYMLLGNHDYGGNGAGTEPVKAGYQVAYTSSKWRMPAAFYTRSHEHVAFFTFDTTPYLFADQPAQTSAMQSAIAGSSAYWKLALAHHPYRSNGVHGNAGNYDGSVFAGLNGSRIKVLYETAVCGKAQVLLTGHDHNQQWLQQHASCAGTELIVSGAGAKLTAKRVSGPHDPVWFENYDQLGFVYVVIRDRTLTAQVVGVPPTAGDSSVLFERTIVR